MLDSGASASMLDHYYDKLIQISNPPPGWQKKCPKRKARERVEPLLAVLLKYGATIRCLSTTSSLS